MKKLFFLAYLFILPILASAQDDESTIRTLERNSIDAIVRGDTSLLFDKYWSPKLVVNIPTNRAATLDEIKKRFRSGQIDYSSADRTIDKITFNENVAIVMGSELIHPKGNSEYAGKTVTRRFINIWMKTKGEWKMIARQSTVMKVE